MTVSCAWLKAQKSSHRETGHIAYDATTVNANSARRESKWPKAVAATAAATAATHAARGTPRRRQSPKSLRVTGTFGVA